MFSLRWNLILFLGLLLGGCTAVLTKKLPALQVGSTQNPLEIGGVLQQNRRLGGVIRLSRDLLIPAGRSLQIESGSHLLVVGTDSSKIEPQFLDKGTEILVKGRLYIDGKLHAPVTLSLDPTTPAGENWAGIELVDAESAVLNYVDILGAETGILSIDSSPRLEQVHILGARNGLLLQGRGELIYKRGLIAGGDAGLLCFDRATLRLTQLKILDNQDEGLYLAEECTLVDKGLQVERNGLGVVAPAKLSGRVKAVSRANRVNFKPFPARESDQ